MTTESNDLAATRDAVRARLFAAFHADGACLGRLSDSALAVALASLALDRAGRPHPAQQGRAWLAAHQNADGGWGDTPDSPSNLATTLLTLCALQAASDGETAAAQQARAWLTGRAGGFAPEQIAAAVAQFYGADRTFSAPILSVCAGCGLLGPEQEAWRYVMPLPFEAARLPNGFYKWIRLPVVSYALPALIAIGLARHRKCPSAFMPLRWLREHSAGQVLRKLERLQPASGGFLEAIPLTAFVAINLMAAGETAGPVLGKCLDFLEGGQRPDGGWPIDTDLRSWTTSLAVRALIEDRAAACPDMWREKTTAYLLGVQQRTRHPFTQAEPGGWGWTSLSGAVPDADDTSAALLALHALDASDTAREAARAGLEWLLGLQNRDGGIPTFCRGWANLPFDRSCPDITAHALAAFAAWMPRLPELAPRLDRAQRRALAYLTRAQQPDGSWIPLWFGNQAASRHENPVYGTARVLEGLARVAAPEAAPPIASGAAWLARAQNEDGGWGGAPGVASSIEETALALAALAPHLAPAARNRATAFLVERTRRGAQIPPTPIGLYFSSLWYAEDLYPVIFLAHALARVSG